MKSVILTVTLAAVAVTAHAQTNPFFVFDNRYAVSGVQDSSVFLEALTRSLAEWTGDSAALSTQATPGDVCDLDGRCD